MKRLLATFFVFVALASGSTAEPWSATSIAWLSTGDDGTFASPRVLCSPTAFIGTAWVERHATWARAGLTIYTGNGWNVQPLPAVKELHGLAAQCLADGTPLICHGSQATIVAAFWRNEDWKREEIFQQGGTVFDAASGRRAAYLLFRPHGYDETLYLAQYRNERWTIERIAQTSNIGTARVALSSDGQPTVLFATDLAHDDANQHRASGLYRCYRHAGGWQVERLGSALCTMVSKGRFGLAFDKNDELYMAFMRSTDQAIVVAALDDLSLPLLEPDWGSLLRYPQVDLAFSRQGVAHVIYFVTTPDGGLQIRLARRRDDGTWYSLMVDRTMSKHSLASCALGLHEGSDPFLAYALGPARAVLLAYPKAAAPPGIGK